MAWVRLRSRLIADASGAQVLRDWDRIGRPGTASRSMPATMDHLLAKPDRALSLLSLPARMGNIAGRVGVVLSVVVRSGPVVTAVNGTLVPRPASRILGMGVTPLAQLSTLLVMDRRKGRGPYSGP
jgi:hypothetical protein